MTALRTEAQKARDAYLVLDERSLAAMRHASRLELSYSAGKQTHTVLAIHEHKPDPKSPWENDITVPYEFTVGGAFHGEESKKDLRLVIVCPKTNTWTETALRSLRAGDSVGLLWITRQARSGPDAVALHVLRGRGGKRFVSFLLAYGDAERGTTDAGVNRQAVRSKAAAKTKPKRRAARKPAKEKA